MINARVEILAQVSAVWRRRWYALAAAWLICLIGWAVVVVLPDKYESKARVYIDTSSLLGPLLRGLAVSTDLEQEVRIMQRTLLSRPNLQEVARATDLDLAVTSPLEMEALLDRLEKNADIKAQGVNLFTVSYQDKNPVLAKAVVQALLTIFVETNLGKNRQDMESARAFIESQLEVYERQLKEAEQRVAEFKSRNADVLEGGNFSTQLGAAKAKRAGVQRDLDDNILRRDQLKAQLAVVPQFLKVDTPAQIVLQQKGPSKQDQRIEAMQEQLDAALLQFTENHPDVKMLKRRLENMKETAAAAAKEEEESGSGKEGSNVQKAEIPNTVYEQIQLRLSEITPTIAGLRRDLALADVEVERMEELRLTAPEVEAQFKDLNRDYEVIQKKFQEFLTRRESARISQAAEASTDSVQFRIIAPPQVPVVPSAPNRPLFLGVVLAVGLGAGGGIAFLLAQLDDTFSTARGLTESFGLPVLGTVSMIRETTNRFRKQLGNIGFGMATASLAAVFLALTALASKLSQIPELIKSRSLPSELAWITDIVAWVSSQGFFKGLF